MHRFKGVNLACALESESVEKGETKRAMDSAFFRGNVTIQGVSVSHGCHLFCSEGPQATVHHGASSWIDSIYIYIYLCICESMKG